MTKKEQLRLIDAFYSRMARCCRPRGWADHWGKYVHRQREDEKEHRRFKPAGIRDGISKNTAVKLFCVQHILEWRVKPRKRPDPADILSIRLVRFYGYALFQEFRKEIMAEFGKAESQAFLDSVDYAELMS